MAINLSDSMLSAVRSILIAGGSVLAAAGIEGLDTKSVSTAINDLMIIAPAAVSLGGIIWGVVEKLGTKKVPVAATAIILPPVLAEAAKQNVGQHINLKNIDTAKVVG